MQSGTRVIFNTVVLYAKMTIVILVGLISTRLILKALGVEDYGIYNLVAGVASMLTFLNTSLAMTSQRFLSYALGQDDMAQLKKTFYYSLILHVLIGFCVVLLIETIGIYSIKHILLIAPGKLADSLSILHLISWSVFFSIVAVPYTAVFISRENMLSLSIIEIIDAIIKLGGVSYLLLYSGNRLILYAVIILCSGFISLLLKIGSCYRYEETHLKIAPITDLAYLRELTSFAGWYTFASVGSIGRNQGIPMLLNTFFGVVVNAAYGIANQVNGLILFFSVAIQQSIRPQIIKNEGVHNREKVRQLSFIACRYMFYLGAIFSIPLIIEMPFVLHIWLDNPPAYTVGFCRLVLAATMLFMISSGLGIAIDATGNIKILYMIIGCLHFANIPIGYLLLRHGFSAYSVLWCILFEELLCMCIRVWLSKRIVGISIRYFLRHALIPILIVTVGSFLVGLCISTLLEQGFVRLITTSVTSGITFILLYWLFGAEQNEKQRFMNIFNNYYSNIIK